MKRRGLWQDLTSPNPESRQSAYARVLQLAQQYAYRDPEGTWTIAWGIQMGLAMDSRYLYIAAELSIYLYNHGLYRP